MLPTKEAEFLPPKARDSNQRLFSETRFLGKETGVINRVSPTQHWGDNPGSPKQSGFGKGDSHPLLFSETRFPIGEERRLHYYAKGETIPTVTQGIWQVCKGLVQLSTLYPTGEEGLMGWAGPSMCFSLWLTNLQAYQAKSLSDVYLIWYSIAEVENSPQLAMEILPQLGRRMRQVEALLAIGGQRRVEDRLGQLLLLLKQEMGEPTADGTRLAVRLTHHDIARAINTSRVTVTRLLGKLRHQGVICLDSKRHIIIKRGHLELTGSKSLLRA